MLAIASLLPVRYIALGLGVLRELLQLSADARLRVIGNRLLLLLDGPLGVLTKMDPARDMEVGDACSRLGPLLRILDQLWTLDQPWINILMRFWSSMLMGSMSILLKCRINVLSVEGNTATVGHLGRAK